MRHIVYHKMCLHGTKEIIESAAYQTKAVVVGMNYFVI